jgi:ABC-type multidrug transport system fused ATPase/permease subunit
MSAALPPITAQQRGRGIAQVALCAIGQATAAGVAAFATRDVFAVLREPGATLPAWALLQIAAAGAAIALLRVAESVTAERVGQSYAGTLRLRLFNHLACMPAQAVGNRRTGGLAMRFVGDLSAVRNWISQGIARLVSAGVVLPAATLVLFLLEPRLGLAVLAPLALGLAAMAAIGPRLGPAHRQLRARRARLAADMQERIPHAPELRLLGRLALERTQLRRRTEALVESALARTATAAGLRAVPDLVAGAAAASLLGTAFMAGIPAAEAAGAMAALGLMMHPLRDLSGVWDRWRAWTAARDKCAALLAEPLIQRQRQRPVPGPQPGSPAAVHFCDVGALGLAGVDLHIRPGQKIALIGANGAGKSTLLRLAAGLEAGPPGRVRLDGTDPRDLAAPERRRSIALMSLRSPILAGSLRRALTMGAAQQRSDAEILAQAQAFGLGGVLQRLGGLDGLLSEGGRNLSAGEARRLLLTRVALSGARLLLLDEPEDALDAEGVELLAGFLHATPATVLVATHGLALARRMDSLWFVQQGRVVEAGATTALLRGDGPSARHFRPRAAA